MLMSLMIHVHCSSLLGLVPDDQDCFPRFRFEDSSTPASHVLPVRKRLKRLGLI